MGRPKLIKVDVTDGRGLGGMKSKTINVKTCIDILDYRDTPGFAYLLLAANPDVSVPTLRDVLAAVGSAQEHPATWMYKRRELFKVPTMPPDADARVVAFVKANMKLPVWKTRVQLRRQGINCSAATLYRIFMAILYATSIQ